MSSDQLLPPGPRQLTVNGDEELPLARVIKDAYPELAWSAIRRLCTLGRVEVDGVRAADARRSLPPGSRVELLDEARAPGPSETVTRRLTVRYEDRHVIVVEKPAGISSVPYEGHEKGTLLDLIRKEWEARGDTDPRTPLLVVQRLDKETSGVMVIAKSELARAHLGHQLRRRDVERRYLALVEGVIDQDRVTYRSFLGKPRDDGKRRSLESGAKGPGKEAITEVEVLERLGKATLIRCHLMTGRTHQIRIHLSEAGHPLLGERIYRKGQEPTLSAPRLMLHATSLAFRHPVLGRSMGFESRLPEDFARMLGQLGGGRSLGGRAPRPQVPMPESTRRSLGGKKVRSIGQLLDAVAEQTDWKEENQALVSPPPTRAPRPRAARTSRPERGRREGGGGNFGFPPTEGIGERPVHLRPEEGGKIKLRRGRSPRRKTS